MLCEWKLSSTLKHIQTEKTLSLTFIYLYLYCTFETRPNLSHSIIPLSNCCLGTTLPFNLHEYNINSTTSKNIGPLQKMLCHSEDSYIRVWTLFLFAKIVGFRIENCKFTASMLHCSGFDSSLTLVVQPQEFLYHIKSDVIALLRNQVNQIEHL